MEEWNHDPETRRRVSLLEDIAGQDPGRGIGPLLEATRGDLLGAATSLARCETPHVAIMTGFFIPAAEPPAPETDGPPGAAHLAAALQRAGVPVRLVTDELCASALRAAARAAGGGDLPFDVASKPGEIDTVLETWNAPPPVSHVISIERVGPSADGTCRNMKGDDISEWTAPLDRFFAPRPGRVRIGIGDGGNELGMGKLPRDVITSSIPRGERIACAVDCEHLLVCGVSNWGAIALAAALALVRPAWKDALLAGLTEEADRRILAATVEEGPAVDGMLRRPAMSVDRVSWEDNAAVLKDLVAAADA